MPLYTFIDKNTGKTQDIIMKISEKDEFLETNKHLTQSICAPPYGDTVRLHGFKTSDGFKDILRHAKKTNYGSNIDV